jgi:chemotaxis protein CheX
VCSSDLGDARRELSEKGISLKAGIPNVVTGKDHYVRHWTNGPVIALPYATQAGSFMVEVCFDR